MAAFTVDKVKRENSRTLAAHFSVDKSKGKKVKWMNLKTLAWLFSVDQENKVSKTKVDEFFNSRGTFSWWQRGQRFQKLNYFYVFLSNIPQAGKRMISKNKINQTCRTFQFVQRREGFQHFQHIFTVDEEKRKI